MKTGIVLEGGALRTMYSSGVCDALLDAGVPLPDYCVGVSAGIAYGTSYLSRQSRRNLKIVATYVNDRRYMGMRNLADPRNRAFFGMDFTFDAIPNYLVPYDYDAFAAYPGTVEAVVTSLRTGEAAYLPVPRHDPPNTVLRASCSIPLMFPPVEIDGEAYYDGGCADPIPWKRALDCGCDRVLVVLTRERTYQKSGGSRRTAEIAFRKYPAFAKTMRERSDAYNRCREELFEREGKGEILVIAPEDTLGCSRTERDLNVIRALWQEGYFSGRRMAETVRAFWTA